MEQRPLATGGSGGREPKVRGPPGRALLRLKPSRMCVHVGYYVRYTVPHNPVNALRARLLGGGAGVEPPLALFKENK